ncbi:disulfide oxidoreductase [Ruegeria sp. SCSIO 43209]|uniref:helicase-related protein n=1 Tax=Ruegeria sp. SCSIO 43209 TaxID=2793010 RepID=UPI001CA992CA|nr:helicase-related protein [Ruegeria sp. SCSIO 43209]UAB90710.1 disulfide oxidoreductase [Ruegeria sp. SCSIO 43209]
MSGSSRIVAVLGPTNTGKTHYAIERMLGYRTGVIGLPLRLLAREVYDKIVAIRGPSVVALVTGEERIVPPRTQYWVCTVEAMPEGMGTDFVAIDEIQLCVDPERGHVFTDRLLRSRGTNETLFLGSDTMRGPIAALVPEAQFIRRERMSQLVYSGSKKISRMPARSAIVGFSVDNVYAIAELLRRQKGGAAVVMGALSPRTRNAQVDLYQNGEVDYLVATDAIGMGLNLDVNHVAFSSLTKFDGRRMRPLAPNELAQIAGRAGRGMSDGTFGVTGEAPPLDEGVAQAIMDSRFTPMKKLNWRNAALRFGSIDALIDSLEVSPDNEHLIKARPADDLNVLKSLSQVTEVVARASDGPSIRLLWDVCRIPDFRGISHAEHASLLEVIYGHLHERGSIPDDFMARQIRRIDQTHGDIDALSKRLAYIRTWTYVAQRNGWVRDESHWREETRTVEDRLSDALHDRLTQRFVDRRTSVLLRRLKQKEALLAEVNDKGEVTVEGEFVGRLEGFRFTPDKSAQGTEAKALKSASLQALAPQFHLRADRFYNAPDTEIDFTDQGGLMWGEYAVGKLVAGAEPLKPVVEVFVDEAAGPDVEQKVQRRLQHFIDRKVAALFEPLLNLSRDEELTGLAKGFAFRMVESLGVLPRAQVAQEVKDLDQDARGALRKHGIRFGQFTIFMPLLLKPAPTRLRLVLWALSGGLQEFPEAPPPGLVTVPVAKDAPQGYDTMCGYRDAGERSIRIDMLERLADMLRSEDSRGGFEAKPDMLSITGMTLEQFADLMQGLGYKAERGEREKAKPVPTEQPVAEAEEQPVVDETPTANAEADDVGITAETAAEASESTEAATEAPATEKSAESKSYEPEIEVFYTFTWGRQRQQNRGPRREQGQGKGKPRGKPQGKPHSKKGGKPQGAKTFSSRPPKKEKAIDPDNPFAAALMGLKDGN